MVQQKYFNSSRNKSILWWPILSKVTNTYNYHDRMRIIKYNHNELYTKEKENLHDDTISPICPCCINCIETSNHIMTCESRIKSRQTLLDNIHKCIKTNIKDDILCEVLYTGISTSITRTQPKPPREISQDVSQYLEEACQQQSQIGWDQMCKGRWTTSWESIIAHDITTSNNKKGSQSLLQKHYLKQFGMVFWNFGKKEITKLIKK
jgi:hypothetical protein